MIDFEGDDLVAIAERSTPAEIDAWPFGVIRLDEAENVLVHNAAEKQLSGYRSRPAVGHAFFVDVAPCMNTPDFRGRIEAARRSGEVDIEFGWIGDFGDPERELHVRVLSASGGGLWIFIRRE